MEIDSILSQVIKLAEANGQIEILWLYGSRAKGQVVASSDYDLAVAFKQGEKHDSLLDERLKPEVLAVEWASQLKLSDDMLSVLDINQAPIPLALEVIRPNCVLVCKDKIRLAREENRITSQAELG